MKNGVGMYGDGVVARGPLGKYARHELAVRVVFVLEVALVCSDV